MHKKLPFSIKDRMGDAWSPAMRSTAKLVAKKLRDAKTIKEWWKIVDKFDEWVIENRDIQF